jgi:tetratricopeptide (TPR) repeat protein
LKGIPLSVVDPRIGATVYAIGSPNELSSSLSQGIVSGLRQLPDGNRWLQTTAPISHGSSGGPLLLTNGTLIGVTTLTVEDAQNVNFAIPVSTVRTLLAQKFAQRDIAQGASIDWECDHTFDLMQADTDVTAAQRQAIADLCRAFHEDSPAEYEHAIEVVDRAMESLPDKYKYLAHYVAGALNLDIATQSLPHRSDEDDRAAFRANSHSTSAVQHLRQCTTLRPDFAPAYVKLADYGSYSGDWSSAITAASMLVKLMPRCAEALRVRANSYSELNQLDPAREDLESAIQLAPNTGLLYFELADVLAHLTQDEAAIAAYDKCLQIKSSDYTPSMVHFKMGGIYKHTGAFDKAISEFTQAKNLDGEQATLCDQQIASCLRGER